MKGVTLGIYANQKHDFSTTCKNRKNFRNGEVHTNMHTCMHTYAHTHIHMHACMHAYMHTCMHTCMHTYKHTYTHACIMRTYTQAHIITHIRTYIHGRQDFGRMAGLKFYLGCRGKRFCPVLKRKPLQCFLLRILNSQSPEKLKSAQRCIFS